MLKSDLNHCKLCIEFEHICDVKIRLESLQALKLILITASVKLNLNHCNLDSNMNHCMNQKVSKSLQTSNRCITANLKMNLNRYKLIIEYKAYL